MPLLPWIAAVSALLLVAMAATWWALRPRRQPPVRAELPDAWPLQPRPVFDADERRAFRHLVGAFPHHTVLAKLPLVRFCQPQDPASVRRWYRLLASHAVTFAICSPSGRVLAAVDLERRPPASERSRRIKQEVLAACRVRYLRCTPEGLPTLAELQLLVPHSAAGMRGPLGASASRPEQEESAAQAVDASGRRGRQPLWRDPGFRDSYHGRLASSATAPRSMLPELGSEPATRSGPESAVDLSQDLSEALGDGSPLPPMSARH